MQLAEGMTVPGGGVSAVAAAAAAAETAAEAKVLNATAVAAAVSITQQIQALLPEGYKVSAAALGLTAPVLLLAVASLWESVVTCELVRHNNPFCYWP
jgi:hypothetical protein